MAKTPNPPTSSELDALLSGGLVVKDLLTRRATDSADRPFIRFGTEVATYGDIHDRAIAAASVLAALGVVKSDLVALMLPNSVEYVELFFALAYRGSAVVLVNTDFRGYMLEYVLNDARCRMLVADPAYLDVILESADQLDHLEVILVGGPACDVTRWDDRFAKMKVFSLGELLAGGATDPYEADVSHRDPHCVVYSSGTTGPSKGIVISNAHSLVKAVEVLRICGYTESDTLYSPLPLFYSMGLLRGVLSVALVGSSIALRDRFSVSAFWDDVRAHGATVAHCVFSIPRMLEQVPPSAGERDHALRYMFNAQHNPELEERFGVKMIESYGLTEAGNAIYNRFDEPVVPGSCGRVSDEWEVRLADPVGAEVAIGETGEILIRPRLPDRIMLGYLNKPAVTTTAFRDLWFHTGDLARLDQHGYYFYQGRNKDVIRRRGQNISGWEVEQILLTHPDVADAAALAQPAEVGEDDLRVIVVGRDPNGPIDLPAIAVFCERRMPAFMVPRFYEEVAELPRTPSGRVEKYKLEGTLAPGHFDRGPGGRRKPG
jgi:crotonobetaine/carnitine-CoA ligase